MTDDLVKMCRRLSKYAHAQLSASDLERIADRIEELEAVVGRQHKRAETLAEGWRIADDARIELEAKLAKAETIVRILASAEWDDRLGEAVDLACAYVAEVDEG